MAALTVALLGGASTGKTTLGLALTRQLHALGLNTTLVPDHLRAWRERERRPPLAHEQAAIADAQARSVEAAARGGVQVVVADTTPLMIAAHSERVYEDRSLWAASWKAQQWFQLTLLMGLDVPWQADGPCRDGPDSRAEIDALLRRELQSAGIPFQTVYGSADVRLQHALRAVGGWLGRPLAAHDPLLETGTGRWACADCSDPDCERRLFSALVSRPA